MIGLQHLTLSDEVGERHSLVYAPESVQEPMPVVLFLHGAGGTAEWSLDETRWTETADREGFLLVVPDAGRADPSQPAMFRANPQVWNDGVAPAQFETPARDHVFFISRLLDETATRYAIDERRVYAAGFSNGGSMVLRLGIEIAHRFAGFACVAGHSWHEAEIVPGVSTVYLVGTEDPLVPLAGGEVKTPWGGPLRWKPPVERSVLWLKRALGCPEEPTSRSETTEGITEIYGPGCEQAMLHVHITNGLGHHWPGGRGRLSKRLFGSPRDDIDANSLIWEFFCR